MRRALTAFYVFFFPTGDRDSYFRTRRARFFLCCLLGTRYTMSRFVLRVRGHDYDVPVLHLDLLIGPLAAFTTEATFVWWYARFAYRGEPET